MLSLRRVARKVVVAPVKTSRRFNSDTTWQSFANVDPWKVSADSPHTIQNLVRGQWKSAAAQLPIVDPWNGDKFMSISDTKESELDPFVESLAQCPKSGLHNAYKNPERYRMYGAVSAKAAYMMKQPEVNEFFIKLIQRVAPKSHVQAKGEVDVTQQFLENFGGDQVRFLARSFGVAGDHAGQLSTGHRWPFGPVVIIAPFNFPLEIPLLQLMGALFMGNKVCLKADSRVAAVMEQALRLLHHCGMPMQDVDFINSDGPTMHKLLMRAEPRMTQFTGSSKVAELLARDLHGKIKLEDAGWDWKVLGPDVSDVEYVAYVSDQDAYAYSGQKCSAQSALFLHSAWVQAGFLDKIKTLAARRSIADSTSGPVLTVTNETLQAHVKALLEIPGAELLFGGDLLTDHTIPACYGSFKPTAVKIPLSEMLKPGTFELATTEIFGPFQIVVEYGDGEEELVLQALERTTAHLTAAIVSKDIMFQNRMLGGTVNGTTYVGLRARTTGAPQNHWFGPAGDPRGGGIGTPEAIRMVWSCHREVILDQGPLPANWTLPPPS
ncbi:Aldehyde/histidinol dehydrogenase [Ochromonadaceae sp. CCMP2298]|nr:Aldehyde/histidinol dehydrogenase [Ochromonadaceae sp. CCMP2298]|mmetsp:Transcript_11863/g.26358  ORF Transcript_11863/g.26358 Transcript_11863/m.26358 type:complete len:550 (-) Transcript_11863:336-1985(-)|eukprot:CAMPEP_0173198430 /NCGR_PEP_ID=MMETSP1141-20130122/16682_1 /TAXON_ID=483371 /ORGANISM="non described non described, Strain CCMP2298" /LENGTH=549 /DNA_ID=CAMNT_0014123221 /DNA_START=79 /DNA_END=1728 /DNA_ORIENTATION=-